MKKGHYFSNQEVADLLRKVSSAYLVKKDDKFRVSAYEEAAVSAEHSTTDVKDLWDDGKLDQVPGFGKNICAYIDELFRTGKVKHFEKIFATLPPAMFIFEKIPGIGPKTALVLAKNLKIYNQKEAVSRLKKAAKEGKIKKIVNFGEKSEEDILRGIESLEKGEQKEKRMPLYQADSLAQEIIAYLKESPGVLEARPLGSLRRMLATIGDIDISVSSRNPPQVMEHFFRYPKIKKVLEKGEETLGRVILYGGKQVDIRISSPESYGAMLQYFTGSKQHNISLREFALKRGLSLSEYGIKSIKNLKLKIKNFKDEENFYNFLGLDWIPPELREDTGEIEEARTGNLPKLVEPRDIKGDLHLHSSFPIEPSHDLGESSLSEMINMAISLGYEYIGFTEHNPSVSRHSKSEIESLIKKKSEDIEEIYYPRESIVKNRATKLPVKIFNGLEVDIKPNGELSLPNKCFSFLDFVIVSVHSSFDMDRIRMTERIIKGLSHPKAKILGHPSGRKIGEREGYEVDWEKLFDFCLKNNKILEISAWPNRLDLTDNLVREAVKIGIKLVINTDSHMVNQMNFMKYGVSVARRGWAEKKDILNTLPVKELSAILLQ